MACQPVKDDFRDRVASILSRELPGVSFTVPLAGLLIQELGLHREWSVGDDKGGRVLWLDNDEPVIARDGEVVQVRWITGWECQETLDDVKGDDLRTRLVHAAIESLVEDDPVLVIGVGERELKLGWEDRDVQ
jgi:hypothetical protein